MTSNLYRKLVLVVRNPVICCIASLFLIWLILSSIQLIKSQQYLTLSKPNINAIAGKSIIIIENKAELIQIQNTFNINIYKSDRNFMKNNSDIIMNESKADDNPIEFDDNLSDIDIKEMTFEYEYDNHLYLYDVPYFMNDSILILSMVKNSSEQGLVPSLHNLDEISCIFRNTVIFIYESNSVDKTPEILRHWSHENTNHNLRNHQHFCQSFHYGFDHRLQTHSFDETGDKLFSSKEQKIQSIKSLNARERKSQFNGIGKHIVFGDGDTEQELNALKEKLNGKFLGRIERYSIYRNYMLRKISNITTFYKKQMNISFEYLMIIDLDTFGFHKRQFFNDLYFYHKRKSLQSNGKEIALCAHGTYAHGFYADTFASIAVNGSWYLKYQRAKKYANKTNEYMKGFPALRFQPMKSCFGGLVIYSNVNYLLDSKCKYPLVWPTYEHERYPWIETDSEIYTDENFNQSEIQSSLLRLADLMREWRKRKKFRKRRYKKRDNHICGLVTFYFIF